MSSHLWILAIRVCKIKLGPCGLAAHADALHEPQTASGAEDVGVICRRAIRYRFGGSLVEIGEFVGDRLHLVYS